MKYLILIIPFFLYNSLFAQKVDTTTVNFKGNKFYHITNDTNTRVLVFLHGGIKNPAFKDTSQLHKIDFLLEGNELFLDKALKNGFDLLIPQTNDSLNWLTNYNYCFQSFSSFFSTTKKYSKKYISGFSDGGTGSYKIFYKNSQYFDGLAVFNGYPLHENFYKKVDYTKGNNKKVVFFSTTKDKVIPYEFLLTEYCKQKKSNPNTFLYIKKGRHTFLEYDLEAINFCFDVLTARATNKKTEPIHGLVVNDEVLDFYVYRKKLLRKFRYGREYYKENQNQKKIYN